MAYIDYTGSSFQRYTSSNGWVTDGMAQGGYATYASGSSQRGQCVFSGLSGFDLNRYKITSFTVSFTFSAAGGNYAKNLVLFLNSSNNSTYQLSTVQTSGAAYNSTASVTYTSDSDIAKLEAAIKSGNNYVTSYNGETASSGYSSNYCRMTAGTFRIYYEDNWLAKVYDSASSSWKSAKMWVYKTSDSSWHQVGRARKYNTSTITTVPVANFTSNSGNNGFSITADTEYNSDFAAWKVFDGSTGDGYGWASTITTASSHYLIITFPYEGYLKSITIKNRDSTWGVCGPNTLYLNGLSDPSDLSNTQYSQAVTGLPGSTALTSTTITLDSTNQSKLIKALYIYITDWDTKSTTTTNCASIQEISLQVLFPWGI